MRVGEIYSQVKDLLSAGEDYEMIEEFDAWASEHDAEEGGLQTMKPQEEYHDYITQGFFVGEAELLKKHGLKLPIGRETVGYTRSLTQGF